MATPRGQVIDVRGESDRIARNLAMIGQGLREVADPHFEQKQRVKQFLLRNPGTFQRMAEAQARAEERAADKIADAQTEEGQMPNVLAPFNFSFEEARALLSGAPPLTPEQELTRRQAGAQMDVGLPGAQAEAAEAQAGAQEEVAETTEATEEEAQRRGISDVRARQRVEEARAGAEQAEFTAERFGIRSGRLQGELDNLKTNVDMSQLDLKDDQIRDYIELRADVREGKVPNLSFADLRLAEQNPKGLSAILSREKMGLRDQWERLQAMQDQQDRRLEMLKFVDDRRDRVDEARNEIIEHMREGDIDDDALQSEIADFNQEVAGLAEVAPDHAANMVATATEGFLGSMGVEFKPTEGFIDLLGRNPEQIQPTLELLKRSRTGNLVAEDRLPNPDEDGFEGRLNALAGRVANSMMNSERFQEVTGPEGILAQRGAREGFAQSLQENIKMRLEEQAKGLEFGVANDRPASETLSERGVLDRGTVASQTELDRIIGGFIKNLFVDPRSEGAMR